MTQAPVRQDPSDQSGFGARRWQIRVGVVNDAGHVAEKWQDSPDLTRIMNATARRVIRTTEEQIERRWAEREAPTQEGPSIRPAGTPAPPTASAQPTMHARFTSGIKPVYSTLDGEPQRLRDFRFYNSTPYFMVLLRQPAPKGYVWVIGADYNTHAAIRSATVWNYVATVKIPRPPKTLDPNSPDFMRSYEPHEYMNAEELNAWNLHLAQLPGVFFRSFSTSESSVYRGEVKLYERGPNYGAQILVERGELTPE
jgi:hypothetical protein